MKRLILSLPADLPLTTEAGDPVITGLVVYPMPGTIQVDGRALADVYTQYGDILPPEAVVLACQDESGAFDVDLDAAEFLKFLAPVQNFGTDGHVTDTQPATLHQPHVLGGWPDITQPAPDLTLVVPEAVTMRQARLALLASGRLQAVEDAITMIPGPEGVAARIEWEYAHEIRRDSPLVTGLAAALGLTDGDLDALFIGAAGA